MHFCRIPHDWFTAWKTWVRQQQSSFQNRFAKQFKNGRYAKKPSSCFSSEENISWNKLSETSAINTFRKMSASGSSNFYSKSKRQKNRQIKGGSEFHECFRISFIFAVQNLPSKNWEKSDFGDSQWNANWHELRRIGIHFAQMGFAHDDWAVLHKLACVWRKKWMRRP